MAEIFERGARVRFIGGLFRGRIGKTVSDGYWTESTLLYYDVVIAGRHGGWTQAPDVYLERVSAVDRLGLLAEVTDD